jgi:hypothetical protein
LEQLREHAEIDPASLEAVETRLSNVNDIMSLSMALSELMVMTSDAPNKEGMLMYLKVG